MVEVKKANFVEVIRKKNEIARKMNHIILIKKFYRIFFFPKVL